jgi:predicted MFS family arabinose efflux permease
MSGSHPRLFYGWWVVLTCALPLFLGPIPILIFSFGVFLKPLVRDFHAGRGTISFALTLTTIGALCVPLAGRLIDRIGARKVILPANVAASLIFLAAYFCSDKIWQLYLFYLLLGIVISGVIPVSYCYVVSHWFDRHRGLALGLMMAGLGTGAVVMPTVAQYLIARLGWRLTFGVVGASILVITVPVLNKFLVERPDSMGLLPDGMPHSLKASLRPVSDGGMTLTEAWRKPDFWLLLCAVVLVSASVTACLAHIAAILTDRGASAKTVALATSLFGAGVLIGRTGSGYLLDRFRGSRVTAVIFASAAAGIGLLRIEASQQLAFAAAFFIGLGQGAEVDIMAFLISRYFGLRAFGAIYGVIFAAFALSGGLGTYLMGVSFDVTGSYALMLAGFCIAAFIGAALMLRLGPYRYQPAYAGAGGPEPDTVRV